MAKFAICVTLTVEAEDEDHAYSMVDGAVQNLVCGDIEDYIIDTVDEVIDC